jgi:hypothetical protein
VLKLHTMPACAQRTAAQLRLCLRRAAFEDFIGRGDRRIGAVIQRAWELGATNDAWWQNADACYQAWSQAIADCGMDWKYRQVESGEWDVLEHLVRGRVAGW